MQSVFLTYSLSTLRKDKPTKLSVRKVPFNFNKPHLNILTFSEVKNKEHIVKASYKTRIKKAVTATI